MATELRLNFGDFILDTEAWALLRGGEAVRIQRKPLEVLSYLARHRDRVVPRSELLGAVWPGVRVSEQAVASALRDLRRALGDTDSASRTILTLRGVGYRFVAVLREERPRLRSAPEAARPETAPASRPGVPSPFVERDDVMRRLLSSLKLASRGETRLSFVVGPPGIGKTRALRELEEKARGAGASVHVASSYDGEGATSFWPWRQILRSCLRGLDAAGIEQKVGALGDVLSWIAPDLAPSTGALSRHDLGGAEARFRVFDAVTTFLSGMSQSQPLLLLLDDIQWSDEASLLLLEFLAQSARPARLHVVAALRDTEIGRSATLDRVLGTSARQSFADRIDLRGFGREAIAEVLGRAAGTAPAPAFVEAVFAATLGNPFYVAEIGKLASAGELKVGEAGAVPVPSRVRDAIRLSFRRLSPECERLLELGAVAGPEIELPVLSEASGLPPSRVMDLVSEAEAAGFVVHSPEEPQVRRFSHDLVREALRLDLAAVVRQRLHLRLAEVLEAIASRGGVERSREIALHYAEAAPCGVARKAVFFLRRAAEGASRSMAFEDAVGLYGRASSTLRLVPDASAPEHAEIAFHQAEAAWGTLEPASEVQARFVAAAEGARRAGSKELFARAVLGRTGYGVGCGDFRHIMLIDATDIQLLEEARATLGNGDSPLGAAVLARLGLAVRYAEGLDVAIAHSEQALQMGKRLGNRAVLAEVLRYRHEVLSGPRFAEERRTIAAQVLELAREVGSRPLELDGLYFGARDAFEQGDARQTVEWGNRADALAATMRQPGALFRSGIRHVLTLTLGGAFEKAQQRAREYYERDGLRNLSARGTYRVQIAMLRGLVGDHQGALASLADEIDQNPGQDWVHHAVAREQALGGNLEEARRHFTAVSSAGFRTVTDDHCRLGSLLSLAEVCVELGDVAHAERLYSLLLPHRDQLATAHLATTVQGASARGLGMLACLLGWYELGDEHFQEATRLEETFAAAPLLAITHDHHAALLFRWGGQENEARARRLLDSALATATRLGMSGVGRRAAGMLKRAAVPSR